MGKKEGGEHDSFLPCFPSRNLRPLKRMSESLISGYKQQYGPGSFQFSAPRVVFPRVGFPKEQASFGVTREQCGPSL